MRLRRHHDRAGSRGPIALAAVIVVVLVAAAAVAGCGGGMAGGAGGRGGTGTGSGSLTAVIDGQAWASDATSVQVAASASVPGALTISGTRVRGAGDVVSLTLTLGYLVGPATYPLGVNSGTTGGGLASVLQQSGGTSNIWTTELSGSAGTLTLVTMDAARITGTFDFMTPPQSGASPGAPGTTVTSGAFDLPLPGTFTPLAADEYGSVVSAVLDRSPWNAATVVATGDATTGVFGLSSSNTSLNLTMTPNAPVSAGNTYDQTTFTFQAIDPRVSTGWGGMGSTLSVKITAIGGKRASGTFTATLPPLGGVAGVTPLMFQNGTFDVRVGRP